MRKQQAQTLAWRFPSLFQPSILRIRILLPLSYDSFNGYGSCSVSIPCPRHLLYGHRYPGVARELGIHTRDPFTSGRDLTNRCFPVSNVCHVPLSGGFPDPFFPGCQKHLLPVLAQTWAASCLISSPVTALSPSRGHVGGKPAAQGHGQMCGQCWPCTEHGAGRAAHPMLAGLGQPTPPPPAPPNPGSEAKPEEAGGEVRKAGAGGRDAQGALAT